MSRRAVRRERRELAILGALAEYGRWPVSVETLAMIAHRPPRAVCRDVERLMDDCRVMRVTGGSLTERTQVRLATSAERGLIVPAQRTTAGGAK